MRTPTRDDIEAAYRREENLLAEQWSAGEISHIEYAQAIRSLGYTYWLEVADAERAERVGW